MNGIVSGILYEEKVVCFCFENKLFDGKMEAKTANKFLSVVKNEILVRINKDQPFVDSGQQLIITQVQALVVCEEETNKGPEDIYIERFTKWNSAEFNLDWLKSCVCAVSNFVELQVKIYYEIIEF